MGKPSPALATLLLLWRKAKSYSSPAQRSWNHKIIESFQLEKTFKVMKMMLFLLQRKFHSGEVHENAKF